MEAPEWAAGRVSASGVRHIALIIVLRDYWRYVPEGVTKMQVAERFGISRWTLDRYLAEIERIDEEVGRIHRNERD